MDKIMVAAICLPSQEEVLLPQWLSYFDQIQYAPNQLENYITKPNTQDLDKNTFVNMGRMDIFSIALSNNIDWVLLLDINLKADIDIIYQMLKPAHPFVIKNVDGQKIIMLHKSIFKELDFTSDLTLDADDLLIDSVEKTSGIEPFFI